MPNLRPMAILACVIVGLAASPPRIDSAAPAQTQEPRVVEVIARRYEFVPSSIEVTQGERVRLVVKSGDGLHGFGLKKFRVSKEIPRGASVTIDFTADEAGEFPFVCTEFCGDGHEDMKGTLIVKAREAVQP